eukprot:UN30014
MCSGLKHFLHNNWSEPLVGLNLYYCTKLKRIDNQYSLEKLLIQYAPDLEDLNISEIRNLTFHTLYTLIIELKKLTRLAVYGSFRKRKKTKKKLAESPPRTREDVKYLSELENIIQSGETSLEILDIQDCTLLSGRK